MLRTDETGASESGGRPRIAPAPRRSALERCLDVPVAEFADRYWSKAALLTPQASQVAITQGTSQGFADLFSTGAVDELISRRGLRTPFLRMAKNGSVLASASFTRSGGSGASIADQVADDKVLAQLAGGATLVLQALHRTWPPLIEFGTELAGELGHPVQINAYITPPQNQGFAAHYDTHDVFVLQVSGSKQWTIHPPVLQDPLPNQTWDLRKPEVEARATEKPLLETVLQPGDALYLPRGFLHSAVAQGEVSIHLTVGVHPLTAYDLAKELIDAAANDRELRRSLPMGVDVTDVQALTEHVRSAAERLASAVNGASPERMESVARRVGRRHKGETRPQPLAPLAQLTALRALEHRTPLRLRSGLRPAIRRAGERVNVEVLDSTINFPVLVHEALLMAMTGAEFRPCDLPNLDDDDQLVLTRRLLREGIVVPGGDIPGA